MSEKYLGKQFDIHGGGMDLAATHHTNEIAQTQACYHTVTCSATGCIPICLLLMAEDE